MKKVGLTLAIITAYAVDIGREFQLLKAYIPEI
jgi:hypothetical protein